MLSVKRLWLEYYTGPMQKYFYGTYKRTILFDGSSSSHA